MTQPAKVQPFMDASQLHHESFVFDYVPTGEPFLMTDRHQSVMEKALSQGWPIANVIRTMLSDRLLELECSEEVRGLVRKMWVASGVNGLQLTLGGQEYEIGQWDALIREIGYWHRRVRVGDMRLCETADELERCHRDRVVGVMFGLQDTLGIGQDLDRLNVLRDFGVRVVQLTYNSRNWVGDGCTEPSAAGLSRFGIDFVRRLNELDIVVDLSHCGSRTTFDAIEHSTRPVAVTHACCAAIAEHPRAKTDDVLRALRDKDGFFGVLAVPFFLQPTGGADLDCMLRHLEHACQILTPQRVGIATDWGAWTPDLPPELAETSLTTFRAKGFSERDLPQFRVSIPEFKTWESWPNITTGLVSKGWSKHEVQGFVGGNWLSFLRRTFGR